MEKKSSLFSGHVHAFDQGLAINLGLHAAIVYNHIIYWLKINAAKKNIETIEDKYWMFESQKEIADFLGYINKDEVHKAIKELLKNGLLIKGNFNKNPFDKTNWYTVQNQDLILPLKEIKKNSPITPPSVIDNAIQRHRKRPPASSIYSTIEEQNKTKQQHSSVVVLSAKSSQETEEIKKSSVLCAFAHAQPVNAQDGPLLNIDNIPNTEEQQPSDSVVVFSDKEKEEDKDKPEKRAILSSYGLSRAEIDRSLCLGLGDIRKVCLAANQYVAACSAENKPVNAKAVFRKALKERWQPNETKADIEKKKADERRTLDEKIEKNKEIVLDLSRHHEHKFDQSKGFYISGLCVILKYHKRQTSVSLGDENCIKIIKDFISKNI